MYTIEIKKKALKQIEILPKKERQRIFAALDVLQDNPFAGKPLDWDYKGAWSLRVWPYRILYTIHQEVLTVSVFKVGHRKDVYR